MSMEKHNKRIELFNAVINNDISKIQNLLIQDVNPNCYFTSNDSKYNQMTPLCVTATKHSQFTITDMLIKHGADVNWINEHGATALIYSVLEDHTSIAESLLSKGADPNINKNWGGTALHWAAHKGSLKSVYILLNNGADPTLKNSRNKTAAEWALANEHKQIATLLEHAENKWKKNSDDTLVHRSLPFMDMGITTIFNFKSMTATRIFKHFDMQQTRQTEMHFSDKRLDLDEIHKAKKEFKEQGGEIDEKKFIWSIEQKYKTQTPLNPRTISRRKKNSP